MRRAMAGQQTIDTFGRVKHVSQGVKNDTFTSHITGKPVRHLKLLILFLATLSVFPLRE